MRKELKYGFALLLAILVAPACGRAQGQPTDKTITVFGQAIHYFDTGSGPVVVLLPLVAADGSLKRFSLAT